MEYSTIKAFFFDLDGTLRLPDPSPVDAFFQIAQTLDITADEATIRRVKLWAYQFWGRDQQIKEDMEQLGIEQFWINYSSMLLDNVDPQVNTHERAAYITHWFRNEYQPTIHLAPKCYETLKQLKDMGYVLGLISNRTEPLYQEVSDLGLDTLFDFTLAAGEVGYWKPNPTIFLHALSFFPKLTPESCIYVGDNYYADTLGAQAAGLIPVTFDPDQIYHAYDLVRIEMLDELLHLATDEIPI